MHRAARAVWGCWRRLSGGNPDWPALVRGLPRMSAVTALSAKLPALSSLPTELPSTTIRCVKEIRFKEHVVIVKHGVVYFFVSRVKPRLQ